MESECRSKRYGLRRGLELGEVDKFAPATCSAGCLVSGEDVSPFQHNTNELALAPHPLFLVKPNETWCRREDGVVASYPDLKRVSLSMDVLAWTGARNDLRVDRGGTRCLAVGQ